MMTNAAFRSPNKTNLLAASAARTTDLFVLREAMQTLRAWPVWVFLSLNDIRGKYRRAILGPWWIVLGMTLAMSSLALVWSIIFDLDWKRYLPYLMAGYICWQWISGYIVQSCDMLHTDFSHLLRSSPASPMIWIFRFVMRGFWMFLHYLPIWLGAAAITGTWPTAQSLFFLPLGIFIVLAAGLGISLILGMAGARFRDLSPAIAAIMVPMMMLTPVMWHPKMLGAHSYIADINPFTYYIAIVRQPLLGEVPSAFEYLITGVITFALWAVGAWAYQRYRTVMALWV